MNKALTTVTKNRAHLLFLTRELRSGTTITESEVIAIRRRWSARFLAAHYDTAHAERELLREALPMRIADGQARKGLLWWHQQLWTKEGKPRNTQFLRLHEEYEPGSTDMLRRIVKNFDCFTLDDFSFECEARTMRAYPVYSMWSRDKECVTYLCRPWQNGGVEFID